jgi:hypothetical protein
VVHHCGLEKDRPRGSTALLGAADAQIVVKKLATNLMEAIVEYLKDGPDGHRVVGRLEVVDLGEDEFGERISSCVILPVDEQSAPKSEVRTKLSPNENTMLSILRAAGPAGTSIEEWNERGRADGIGVKRRADLSDIRRSLKEKGFICEGANGWFVKQ